MDPRFLPHNTHLEDAERFAELDHQLRQLHRQRYQHKPALLQVLPTDIPGIYTLGGGRQVGKTTLLKQWMQKLLIDGVPPKAIAFLSGELIDNHHTLLHILQTQLANMPTQGIRYLLLDGVTYIQDWDKAIKYAADAGWLEDIILLLTGSDLVLMQEARMRFPGRRGKAAVVNFHLYPLSFRETILLKHGQPTEIHAEIFLNLLALEFDAYLLHGGYLTAINDMASHGRILESTLITYSDWIRGDMLKRGKQEHYLREILGAIVKRYACQVSWNALAKDLSIDHPKTVSDYVALLASMDAVFVQAALLEDKLSPAPKKARKLMFADPFIFHAVRQWLMPEKAFYENKIQPILLDPVLCSKIVEACVVTHYRRFFPTYYIKAEGEVDLAYVTKSQFWPIEIKWTEQLRSVDLKQIAKYKNSKILTKHKHPERIMQIETEFLPLHLFLLDAELESVGP
jgi:predicted AAA+ superfamily ATPase